MGRSNQTFSVSFYLKKNWRHSSSKGHIYQRITIDGVHSVFSINRSLAIETWDSHKGLVKSKLTEASDINPHIEVMRNKAYNAYITLLESRKSINPQMIIDELLGKSERQHSMINLFESHNMLMKSMIGVGATYGNYKNFRTSLKCLKEFVHDQYHCEDIQLIDLDKDFITNYYLFLQQVKHCHHNGAIKQLQREKK